MVGDLLGAVALQRRCDVAYRSPVTEMLEWPNRSCMTLRCTPLRRRGWRAYAQIVEPIAGTPVLDDGGVRLGNSCRSRSLRFRRRPLSGVVTRLAAPIIAAKTAARNAGGCHTAGCAVGGDVEATVRPIIGLSRRYA